MFGAAEREKVEAVLPDLVSHVRDDYAASPTSYDGRWVSVVVDRKAVVADVERLLFLKRAPRKVSSAPKLVRSKRNAG